VSAPRIRPLPEAERDDRTRELLAGVKIAGAEANIFTTLARHPGLMRHWLPFGGKLMAGRLPARDRELLILRTGWNCRAEYEFGQHARLGRAAGLDDSEIRRVTVGPDAPEWDPFDAALLHAADELHSSCRVSDETWDVLAGRYDERQLIEVPMLVGQYHLVAMTLNTLGVQREDDLEGFPT
jgi:4-carboxymuconolactone decarboxylase